MFRFAGLRIRGDPFLLCSLGARGGTCPLRSFFEFERKLAGIAGAFSRGKVEAQNPISRRGALYSTGIRRCEFDRLRAGRCVSWSCILCSRLAHGLE
jgi:hypothetical protein